MSTGYSRPEWSRRGCMASPRLPHICAARVRVGAPRVAPSYGASGPVAARDLNARMLIQPGRQGVGGPFRQNVDRPTGLDVDQDRAVAMPAPRTPASLDTKSPSPTGSARRSRRGVNSQLRDLYGPMFALVDTNERIWEALRANGLPPASQRDADTLGQGWSARRDTVLMPANMLIRDLIIEQADLLL